MRERLICFFAVIFIMTFAAQTAAAQAYFPYINSGAEGDIIADGIQISAVTVSDSRGNALDGGNIMSDTGEIYVRCRIRTVNEAKAKSVALIAAAYTGGGVLTAAAADKTEISAEAHELCASLMPNGDGRLKAFLLEDGGSIAPILNMPINYSSKTVNVRDITVDGESIKDRFDNGFYEYPTLPASYTKYPSVTVLTDNPSARCEVDFPDTFPLTLQGDTQAKTSLVNISVYIGKDVKERYTVKFTQEAPKIGNVRLKALDADGALTAIDETTEIISGKSRFKAIQLCEVKEPTKYKRVLSKESLRTKKADELGINKKTASAANYFPSDYMPCHSDRTTMMFYDISPELLGGTMILLPRSESTNRKWIKAASKDVTDEDKSDTLSFTLNRSATVYVYPYNLNGVAQIMNNAGFDEVETGSAKCYYNGDQNGNYIGIKSCMAWLFQLDSLNIINRACCGWYRRSYEINDGMSVKVNIPACSGYYCTVVKFWDKRTVINPQYTYVNSDGIETKTPEIYENVFDGYGDDSMYAAPISAEDGIFGIIGTDDELLGAELIRIK